MEWFGDRHGGDLGTDLLGEEDALLDGFSGEIRPVSRDQNIPEHIGLLLSPLLPDDRMLKIRVWSISEGRYGIIIPVRKVWRHLTGDGNMEITVAPNRQNKALDTEMRLWDVSENISGTIHESHVLPLSARRPVEPRPKHRRV